MRGRRLFTGVPILCAILFSFTRIAIQTGLGALSSWVSTTPLQREVGNLAVVSYGKWIYAIGGGLTPPTPGAPPPPIRDVYYAQILSDGSLSEWYPTSPLLDTLAGHAAVITDSTIYVIGGYNGSDLSRDTIYATIQADGSLSPWVRSNSRLDTGISAHGASVRGEYIYVTGGCDGSSSIRSVYRARILTGGNIDYWERLLDMDQSTYRHTSEIYGDKLYVIGGREWQGSVITPHSSVYVGQIGSDGTISNWTSTEFLPQDLYFHGSVLSEDERKIYTFGGYDGSSATDKAYRASIKADGDLDPWIEVGSLGLRKELFRNSAVLAANGSVYLVGGKYNNLHIDDVYFIPPLSLTKSNDPTGPLHEGEVITYTISYANTSLITQTITITDLLPFNVTLLPNTVSHPGMPQGSTLVWNLGDIPPGGSGEVSFQAQVPQIPPIAPPLGGAASSSDEDLVEPVPIVCATTRFLAAGVTIQPPPLPNSRTIQMKIPPGTDPSEMWLLMKGTNNMTPTVGGHPAQLVTTTTRSFGASLWSASFTPTMVAGNQVVTVTTCDESNSNRLNTLFLFDKDNPPFYTTALDALYDETQTFPYIWEIPPGITQTTHVILPVMDIIDKQLDMRVITLTVQVDDRYSSPVITNDPNLGDGLLMPKFSFVTDTSAETITSTVALTVTVDTEDSVYILGPRICWSVWIKNTAWLCSQQAGCISGTAANPPPGVGGIYLPIILKSSP